MNYPPFYDDMTIGFEQSSIVLHCWICDENIKMWPLYTNPTIADIAKIVDQHECADDE